MNGKNRSFPSRMKSGATLSSYFWTAYCLQSSDLQQPPQVTMHFLAFSLLALGRLLRWEALHSWPQPLHLVSGEMKVESGEGAFPRECQFSGHLL